MSLTANALEMGTWLFNEDQQKHKINSININDCNGQYGVIVSTNVNTHLCSHIWLVKISNFYN